MSKILLVIFLLFSIVSRAEIIDLGHITRDTSTGLDWLDVTETVGISYETVITQFDEGGAFEGWRYATTAEFDQLINNFGYTATNDNCPRGGAYCEPSIIGNELLIENIINMLGDTYDLWADTEGSEYDVAADGAGYSRGLFGVPSNLLYVDVGMIQDWERVNRATGISIEDGEDQIYSNWTNGRRNIAYGYAGHWLVSDYSGDPLSTGPIPTPIPAALWLYVSSLTLLVHVKRFKARG